MPEAGNGTRFPFFSEVKGEAHVALSALESAVLGGVFVAALLGNARAIALLVRRRRRRRSLRAASGLVLNLFCADLLFISAIPAVLAVRWTEAWLLGDAVCHLLFYVMSLSGSVTILSLAAVSLERVVCIVRLRRSSWGRGRLLPAALLLIWGAAAIATLPLCLFFTVVRQPVGGKVSREGLGLDGGGAAWPSGPPSPAVCGTERTSQQSRLRGGLRGSGRHLLSYLSRPARARAVPQLQAEASHSSPFPHAAPCTAGVPATAEETRGSG